MENKVEKIFPLRDYLEVIYINDKRAPTYGDLLREFQMRHNEVDYIALEEYRQKIGKLGEQYVLEQERERLKKEKSVYSQWVDGSPALDGKNGYDIKSYTADGRPIYIEVKSTTGNWDEPFYFTENEKKFAENIWNLGGLYQIHRVFNIGKNIDVKTYVDDTKFKYGIVSYKIEHFCND